LSEPEGESDPLAGTADVLGEYRLETKTLTVTRLITIRVAENEFFGMTGGRSNSMVRSVKRPRASRNLCPKRHDEGPSL